MPTVFFSYSHKDESHRDKLEVHLTMLKRQGLIETWHDQRIIPGAPIDTTISKMLTTADIVLLLVSPDFLASDYCYDIEMTKALQRHHAGEAVVIPVILRPCDWHEAPFGRLKALPKDGKAVTKWTDLDDAFLDITNGIKSVLSPRGAGARGARPSQRTPAIPTADAPRARPVRSSNLRVAKTFSERDRDEFLHEAFEYIAKYFDASLEELHNRNPNIEGGFRRIDANRFTAVAYRDGKAVARCAVFLGGLGERGIGYSNNDAGGGSGFNEMLSVREDDQTLYLEPMGIAIFRGGDSPRKLTLEGGAEELWSMFVEPLQRR